MLYKILSLFILSSIFFITTSNARTAEDAFNDMLSGTSLSPWRNNITENGSFLYTYRWDKKEDNEIFFYTETFAEGEPKYLINLIMPSDRTFFDQNYPQEHNKKYVICDFRVDEGNIYRGETTIINSTHESISVYLDDLKKIETHNNQTNAIISELLQGETLRVKILSYPNSDSNNSPQIRYASINVTGLKKALDSLLKERNSKHKNADYFR